MVKIYSRFTKDREAGIKAYYYGKASIDKGKQQEWKKGTGELQDNQKPINKMAPVNLCCCCLVAEPCLTLLWFHGL